MINRKSAAVALLSMLPLVACSVSDDDDGGGTIFTIVADGDNNDDPMNPQVLGPIEPGRGFRINGAAAFNDGAMGDDEFDSFNVTAVGAQRLRVTLAHGNGFDLDLAFVDSATGRIMPPDNCDAATSPEVCEMTLADAQSINVEAEALEGGGVYTLLIESFAP